MSRLRSNRVGMGGTATRGPVGGTGEEHGERTPPDVYLEGRDAGAGDHYQPPAEESVAAVEPVAIDPRDAAKCRKCFDTGTVYQDHGDGGRGEPMSCDCEAGDPSAPPFLPNSAPPVSPEPVASAVTGEPEPPPSPEQLTAAIADAERYVLDKVDDVAAAAKALDRAEEFAVLAREALARAIDAKARAIGAGGHPLPSPSRQHPRRHYRRPDARPYRPHNHVPGPGRRPRGLDERVSEGHDQRHRLAVEHNSRTRRRPMSLITKCAP